MHTGIDVHAYVQDLENNLRLILFSSGTADPEGAVLLVRGALADGDRPKSQAVVRLGQAHALYKQLDDADGMARVRYGLRSAGVRLRHWTYEDRPAFGWDSLTETERRIAGLVAEGLSNRQVADRVFLSPHTVAFHLRHIFWKLGITSTVQLARIAAERAPGTRAEQRGGQAGEPGSRVAGRTGWDVGRVLDGRVPAQREDPAETHHVSVPGASSI
jgi:DNA-binding CsgD family transcriptional regulator